MGVPSKSFVEGLTDAATAKIIADINGFDGELSSAANDPLWALVDACGDPDVEVALLASALAIDRQALPENYQTALPTLFTRPGYSGIVDALAAAYVGGGAANLRAGLEGVLAVVHPLFGEVVRRKLGETVFTNAGDILACFAPSYVARAADRIYTGADASLSDDTTDAASATTADVPLLTNNGEAIYIGSRYKFSHVAFALSTEASADATLTIQYWNGNAWVALTTTDSTVGLSRTDRMKFTPPADWARYWKDGGGAVFADRTPRYYVRIVRGNAAGITPPVATCIQIVPSPVLFGASGHLGVQQSPLAICRITAANTMAVEQICAVDFSRFVEPGIRLRALTPIAQNLTVTLAYTNQAGADVTQSQGSWTAPAALGTKAGTLNGSDTGVRAVLAAGGSIVTTAVKGVFAVEAVELRTPAA